MLLCHAATTAWAALNGRFVAESGDGLFEAVRHLAAGGKQRLRIKIVFTEACGDGRVDGAKLFDGGDKIGPFVSQFAGGGFKQAEDFIILHAVAKAFPTDGIDWFAVVSRIEGGAVAIGVWEHFAGHPWIFRPVGDGPVEHAVDVVFP